MYDYIPYVLENNLAIASFMFDHAILLLALLSYDETALRQIYTVEQKKYRQILLETISYSYNKISQKFVDSEILLTNFRNLLTEKTCKLFKIDEYFDTYLDLKKLIDNTTGTRENFTEEEYLAVQKINNNLIKELNKSMDNLNDLADKVKIGNTLFFSEGLVTHFTEETKIFLYTLDFFQRRMSFTPTYIYRCKYYFNIFLKEHAQFLKHTMFPVDYKYYDEVRDYIYKFDKIIDNFDDDITPHNMFRLSKQTKETTEAFIDYNIELLRNMIHNKYFAASIPLLNDHILRESKYVIYQLDKFKSLI